MAGRRKASFRARLVGYALPRIAGAVAILAAGALVSVVFNLMSPRGVLARTPAAVRPANSPALGKAGPARTRPARPSRKEELLPGSAASAVVLVSSRGGNRDVAAGQEPVKGGEKAELRVIDLAAATKYLASGGAIFVDARSHQRWEMGHVPGAIDVPSSDFDRGFAEAEAKLPRDATIVVYCESASCDQAEDVAGKLMEKGYRHLLHFKDGWLVWEFSNQPQERSGKWAR